MTGWTRTLTARLLAGQVLVLAAGAGAAVAAALLLGPAIFHDHLSQAGHATDAERQHAEQAFRSAGLVALVASVIASAAVAFGITWYLTRRIRRPLQALTTAASSLRDGHYDVAVPSGGGAEFDALATTFTSMAERLRTIEQTRRRLLTDLSHEMRTPIATLEGYLDGLEDGVVSWDGGVAELLRTQTHRLARLAGDLREVSQAEEGALPVRRIPLVVAHLVGDAVAAAREGASRAGVTLTQRDGAPGAMIRGDAVRLGQVLTNLIGNAVRHTPSGGQVEVSWERRPGGGVRLVVSDTGEGVAAEHLPHLTERFYRVGGDRAIGEGRSGVGLTISKALVEAHGGRLAVDSPGLGGGTVVTVDLPDG